MESIQQRKEMEHKIELLFSLSGCQWRSNSDQMPLAKPPFNKEDLLPFIRRRNTMNIRFLHLFYVSSVPHIHIYLLVMCYGVVNLCQTSFFQNISKAAAPPLTILKQSS